MNNYSNSIITTPRIERFGKGASAIRSERPLTDEQLFAAAPSVFAEDRHEGTTTDRYTYIPTSMVLAALRKEGFQPYSAQQSGAGDLGRRAFAKHMIRLRHETALTAQVGQTFTEIVLTNSHDGSSTGQLAAGLWRLACANGLVASEGLLQSVKVQHRGDIIQTFIDGCYSLMQGLPALTDSVQAMQAIRLTRAEQVAFAQAALVARYDDAAEAPIEAPKLLELHRHADAEPTLWNTFNVVQENVIKGGARYVTYDARGKRTRRQTREIKGIDQNVGVNKALWTLAEEMRKLKA